MTTCIEVTFRAITERSRFPTTRNGKRIFTIGFYTMIKSNIRGSMEVREINGEQSSPGKIAKIGSSRKTYYRIITIYYCSCFCHHSGCRVIDSGISHFCVIKTNRKRNASYIHKLSYLHRNTKRITITNCYIIDPG